MKHLTRKCSIAAESHIRSHYSTLIFDLTRNLYIYNACIYIYSIIPVPKYKYFGKPISIPLNIILYEFIEFRVYGHTIKL